MKKMNQNIRKSSLRLDGILLAFIMLLVGSVGSYGSAIASHTEVFSNAETLEVDYNPLQQHFSISENQTNFLLAEIEEKEKETNDSIVGSRANVIIAYYSEIVFKAQILFHLSIPKCKRYILFHTLKLDC